MADTKITNLTTLAEIPAAGDWLTVVDVSDTTMSAQGTNKKIAASYFVNSAADKTFVTGDGTTGVLPQSGTVPVVSRANTFTEAQAITPASGVPLTLTLPTNFGSSPTINTGASDNGTGTGNRVWMKRNSNASTPAAGAVILDMLGGAAKVIWPDATGLLRIGNSSPTNATDTSGGSVIGDQTSNVAFKDIVGDPIDDGAALENIIAAAADVQRFTYKSGAYNGQEFSGIVLDGVTMHRYGKDADDEYPAGKSLNDVTLFGDLVLAIRELTARVAALEAA